MIEFSVDLITGNKLIDEQHKELIEKVNSFSMSCQNGGGKAQAVQMLSYMHEYTEIHFGAEEELQKSAAYPAYEEHKKKHDEFRKTLDELSNMLDELDGPDDNFKKRVQDNVEKWLVNHIGAFDRSVAEYIFMNENPERI